MFDFSFPAFSSLPQPIIDIAAYIGVTDWTSAIGSGILAIIFLGCVYDANVLAFEKTRY